MIEKINELEQYVAPCAKVYNVKVKVGCMSDWGVAGAAGANGSYEDDED